MEHNELKPCPFCGGTAVIDRETICAGHGDFYTRFQIRCRKCRKRGKVVYDCDGEDALRKEIERWNSSVKIDILLKGANLKNREQTIKALHCCSSEEYLCEQCPIDKKTKDACECGKVTARNALSLIKELTEQVEKDNKTIIDLYHEAETYLAQRDCFRNQVKNLTEENARLRSPRFIAYPDGTTELIPSVKSVRADTVREMKEMLTTFFTNDDTLKYNEVDADYINECIDKIAKEMQDQEVDNGREKAKC